MSTAFGNQHLMLNTANGQVHSLSPSSALISEEFFLLPNSANEGGNANVSGCTGDREILSALDKWVSRCADTIAPLWDTVQSSAVLCTTSLHHHNSGSSRNEEGNSKCMLYLVGHHAEDGVVPGANVLYSIHITAKENNTPHFALKSTATLQLPCRVTHISADPDNQQLSLTAENGYILTFSLRIDELVPMVRHCLADRTLTEILNAQLAADSLRSHHNKHLKKSVMSLPGNTMYRTLGASFFQYNAAQYVDDTRFTNSLKPHTLIYPSNHNIDCGAASGGGNSRSDNVARPVSRVPSAACIIERDASHHRTGLMYAVQGFVKGASTAKDSTCDFLLIWNLDHVHDCASQLAERSGGDANFSETKEPSLSGAKMTCIELPKAGVQQLFVSPAQPRSSPQQRQQNWQSLPSSSAARGRGGSPAGIAELAVAGNAGSNSNSRNSCGRGGDWRSSRQAPRQSVLCLDQQGRLWALQSTYRTDFPGPMYPVGYTLITRVIKYTESESELDIVAPVNNGVVSATSSVASTSIAAAASAATVVPSDAGASAGNSNCPVSGVSSGKTSRDDMVGMDIDDAEELPAKRARQEGTAGGDTGAIFAGFLPGPLSSTASHAGDITDLVMGPSSSSSFSRGRLPFTFVHDYFLAHVTTGAAASASATSSTSSAAVLHSHGSPSRSPRVTGVSGQLSTTTPGEFSSPITSYPQPQSANSNITSTITSTNTTGGKSGDAAEVRSVTEQGEQGGQDEVVDEVPEVISWSFDEVVPPPVRVLNGDFDAKLSRQAHTAEALLRIQREPSRVSEKLRQIQEEATEAAIHAEQVKEKARMRSLVKKQQREAEAQQAQELRRRESERNAAAMLAQSQAQAQAQAKVQAQAQTMGYHPGMLSATSSAAASSSSSSAMAVPPSLGGQQGLLPLEDVMRSAHNGTGMMPATSGASSGSHINKLGAINNQSRKPPPQQTHNRNKLVELMLSKGYLPDAPVVTKKIKMPPAYQQLSGRPAGSSSAAATPKAGTTVAVGASAVVVGGNMSAANTGAGLSAVVVGMKQPNPPSGIAAPRHGQQQVSTPHAPATVAATVPAVAPPMPLSPSAAQHMELYKLLSSGGSAQTVAAASAASTGSSAHTNTTSATAPHSGPSAEAKSSPIH